MKNFKLLFYGENIMDLLTYILTYSCLDGAVVLPGCSVSSSAAHRSAHRADAVLHQGAATPQQHLSTYARPPRQVPVDGMPRKARVFSQSVDPSFTFFST